MKIRENEYSPGTIAMRVVAFVVIVLLAVFVNVAAAIVALLFLLAFQRRLSPQVAYALALLVLLLCALLTLIEQKSAAQFLANWAYCFFAIGVILHLFNFLISGDAENGVE